MSAPERFQVGDTVRCVNDELSRLTAGAEYAVTEIDNGWPDPRYAGQDWRHEDRTFRLARACRRALGGGA